MKFPLASSPFPPLEVSASQCASYEQLTERLLNETIVEYDRFVREQRRVLNPHDWKPVKRRENVTVYKQREATSGHDGSETASSSSEGLPSRRTQLPKSSQPNWSLPKMLAVGTMVGNLDDVMYGVISPDADAIKIKTEYVHDELVDGRVLYQIQYPTEHDPFRYLALKWFVKAHPASINAVVRPRDLVFIEATGYYRLPSGKCIGYRLLQSIDLPECPELVHLGIRRCHLSSCFLFRQRDDDATVEVYMKSHLEPGGVIPDVLAEMSSANSLIGCSKAVSCAQNKKLAWMMRDAEATHAREHQFQDCSPRIVVHSSPAGKQCCGICAKTFHRLRRTVTCELCHTAVCTRCRTTRKLAHVRRTGDVALSTTAFCKTCITQAANQSSADVARFEYVPGLLEKRRGRTQSEEIRHAVAPPPRSRRGSTPPELERQVLRRSSVPSIALLEGDLEIDSVDLETVDELATPMSTGQEDGGNELLVVPSPTLEEQREVLWRQMNELCAKVEQTYQITKATTKNLRRK